MVSYDVIISPKALSQLDGYIEYIQCTLLNEQAAKAVWDDAMDTRVVQEAGIHLIIATQLPTCDILTGRIKANIPSRIAFKVSGIKDSITIIDQEGAESLLGKGDMLYYPQGHSKPLRLQGAFVSDDEVNRVVGHLKKANHSNYFKNPFSDDENIITLRTKLEEIESDIWK